MRDLLDIFSSYLKPIVLGLVLLVGLGFVSQDQAGGLVGADGFDCKGIFADPEWNRTLCRYHPARVWNTPVEELMPWLARG